MRLIQCLLLSMAIFVSQSAHAILGEQVTRQNYIHENSKFSVSSIPGDRKKVREFFDKSGNVFGTCYDPRTAKNRTQILGLKYSALFTKALSESTGPVRKGHPRIQSIKTNDIVIRSTKLGRSLSFCVYDPNKLPEGVSGDEIR